MKPEPYLTTKDLAAILRVEPKTIQNRLAMAKKDPELLASPGILPRPCSVPFGGPRWKPQTVAQWQAQFDAPDAENKPKRGRPTKADEIKRRLSQSVAND